MGVALESNGTLAPWGYFGMLGGVLVVLRTVVGSRGGGEGGTLCQQMALWIWTSPKPLVGGSWRHGPTSTDGAQLSTLRRARGVLGCPEIRLLS